MRRIQHQSRFWPLLLLVILGACGAAPEIIPDERVSYPSPPDPPRILFLRSLSTGNEIEPGRSSLDSMLFGDRPQETKPIVKPTSVTLHDDKIYVCDSQVGGIYRIDIKGHRMDILRPKGRGALQQPTGIFFDPGQPGPETKVEDFEVQDSKAPAQNGKGEEKGLGEIFVADKRRRQIIVYNMEWKLLRELGPWAKKSSPMDVYAAKDKVYIADSSASCVWVVDRTTGKLIYTLGTTETKAEELKAPTSICLDDEGNVFVVDTIRSRIQVWNKDGIFLRSIGGGGYIPGFFGRPKAVRISDSTLWVIDTTFDNCQILDFDGRALMFFADGGTGPGQLYLPRSLWIGSEGLDLFKDLIDEDFVAEKLIIITNQYGPRKLNFYAFGKSKKFEYPDTPLPARPTKAKPRDEDN